MLRSGVNRTLCPTEYLCWAIYASDMGSAAVSRVPALQSGHASSDAATGGTLQLAAAVVVATPEVIIRRKAISAFRPRWQPTFAGTQSTVRDAPRAVTRGNTIEPAGLILCHADMSHGQALRRA